MSSRPAVTPAEKQALNKLLDALKVSETFYCTGSARYDTKNLMLMYVAEGEGGGSG